MPWIKLAFFELEERKWLLKVICCRIKTYGKMENLRVESMP